MPTRDLRTFPIIAKLDRTDMRVKILLKSCLKDNQIYLKTDLLTLRSRLLPLLCENDDISFANSYDTDLFVTATKRRLFLVIGFS